MRELIIQREEVWTRELEYHWPFVRTVAAMLLDGRTDVDAITAAVDAAENCCGPTADRPLPGSSVIGARRSVSAGQDDERERS